MEPYEDPDHKGNSPKFHIGKPCVIPGCAEPAGTLWSPHWCFTHSMERIREINKNLKWMSESDATKRLIDGSWHHVRAVRLSATEQHVYVDNIRVI